MNFVGHVIQLCDARRFIYIVRKHICKCIYQCIIVEKRFKTKNNPWFTKRRRIATHVKSEQIKNNNVDLNMH